MKAKRVKKLDPGEPLADNAARIIRVRLREMRSLAAPALKPDATREQHDMRIAAKRLRYVLETTGFCFGGPADDARRRARELQDALGELHDCDVMLPRAEAHLDGLRHADAAAILMWAGDTGDLGPELVAHAPHRTSYRGLETLIVYLEARRRLLFDRFRALWAEQEQAGTWEKLERTTTDRLRLARDRRRAAQRAERARERLEAAEREEQEAASRARSAAAELQTARRAARREVVRRPSGRTGGATGRREPPLR